MVQVEDSNIVLCCQKEFKLKIIGIINILLAGLDKMFIRVYKYIQLSITFLRNAGRL